MLTTAVWLMLSSMLCSLHLASAGGSFPKPLTAAEERHYLELAAQGDLAARNVLMRTHRQAAFMLRARFWKTSKFSAAQKLVILLH